MIVLGIDPSSTSTGYGLINYQCHKIRFMKCGCIRPPCGQAFEDRLVFIYDRLSKLTAATTPDIVAVESTFFGKDVNAVAKLEGTRGVILLALKQAGLPIVHYAPTEVKKAVVGNGRATKEQVQFMIVKMLSLKEIPRPLDASDALALALCHVHHLEFRPPLETRRTRPEIQKLLDRMSTH